MPSPLEFHNMYSMYISSLPPIPKIYYDNRCCIATPRMLISWYTYFIISVISPSLTFWKPYIAVILSTISTSTSSLSSPFYFSEWHSLFLNTFSSLPRISFPSIMSFPYPHISHTFVKHFFSISSAVSLLKPHGSSACSTPKSLFFASTRLHNLVWFSPNPALTLSILSVPAPSQHVFPIPTFPPRIALSLSLLHRIASS